MTDKPSSQAGYNPERTERAEQVLLEVWARLGDFHEHLVLIGGLAPRYLVPQSQDTVANHCGTFDVDLAVSLAVADLGTYESIRQAIRRIGFERATNLRGRKRLHSFVMSDPSGPIVLDFLTTKYDGPPEVIRAVQEDLSAIQVEGLGLALIDPVVVPVTGQTLQGGIVQTRLRVCRPIAFIVLKALAFANRREAKDAYDLIYLLRYHPGGIGALARLVTGEDRNASTFSKAMEAIHADFGSPLHDGPVRYGHFLPEMPQAPAQAFAAAQEFLAAL